MKRQPQVQIAESQPVALSIDRLQASVPSLISRVRSLQGPILVVGAQEFTGANLLKALLRFRQDVYGATISLHARRLKEVAVAQLRQVDLLSDVSIRGLIDEIRPRTIFNCTSYETYDLVSADHVYGTRLLLAQRLLSEFEARDITCFLQINCAIIAGINESDASRDSDAEAAALANVPDNDYALADEATIRLISSYGQRRRIPCAAVRLQSPYGPWLDPSDARSPMAAIFESSAEQVDPLHGVASHAVMDSLYIDDAVEAVVTLAASFSESQYGLTFEVGADAASTGSSQAYPVHNVFGWQPATGSAVGLERTLDWFHSIGGFAGWQLLDTDSARSVEQCLKNSVSAVIACYNEGLSIPIMYQRLRDTFVKLGIDYEIIFVNNASTDNSEQLITTISAQDPRVMGITHSRSFGAETSFRSGLELASKEACVLLDGDLQDPPEMIEQFVEKWREGYDVVYGRRIKREAPLLMQASYKLFYRLFSYFSYFHIPQDAGDFSLIDMSVVKFMLEFKERDLWLRGIRAYVGFKQTGVDYIRPDRMFGKTSNNILKNIGWAKKGILSFTRMPLDALSNFAMVMVALSILLGILQVTARLLFPEATAWGITTTLITILFFGSINLFAISLLGEYIAKIFDEVKQRPLYIRRSIIRGGEIKPVSEVYPGKELS